MDRFYVLTGGPSSGKSTLIDALEQAGYCRSREAGRNIIQQQVKIGGQALPWTDPLAFTELMFQWELRSYQIAEAAPGAVFFDRGIPDLAGYLRLNQLRIPRHIEKAIELYRYNRCVFIAPPWLAIFKQDEERRQDFAEAVRTYEAMVSTYSGCGYQLVELPRTTVKERMKFILNEIHRS